MPDSLSILGQTAKLEIAHVLFMDIVSYSKLPLDHQEAVLRTLQAVVSATPEFLEAQAGQKIIRLPTGDGMALVFFEDAEAAARCAIEVSRALKSHPEIPLRMGLHSGPVYRVADINANQNVAGGGINVAQRVMDCGDAGHILASQSVADVLGLLSSWKKIPARFGRNGCEARSSGSSLQFLHGGSGQCGVAGENCRRRREGWPQYAPRQGGRSLRLEWLWQEL